jgi:hypothetical protein
MLYIKKQDLEIIETILNQHFPDYNIWAFGSRVSGKAKKYSDIDLLLIGSKKISFNDIEKAKEDFMESDISIRVDLLDWNSIDENFRKIIQKNYIVIK